MRSATDLLPKIIDVLFHLLTSTSPAIHIRIHAQIALTYVIVATKVAIWLILLWHLLPSAKFHVLLIVECDLDLVRIRHQLMHLISDWWYVYTLGVLADVLERIDTTAPTKHWLNGLFIALNGPNTSLWCIGKEI